MQQGQKIPLPPHKPSADDCCGSGCSPCVFDYYERAISEWNEKYGDVDGKPNKQSTSKSKS